MIAQRVIRLGSRLMLRRHAQLEILDAHHIPHDGACLLVARHYHHLLDGCAIYTATDRPLHLLVGLDWTGTGRLRWVMETLCCMSEWPVVLRPDALERENATPERRADARRLLRDATRSTAALLARGEAVLMFPEGFPVIDPHAGVARANPDSLLPFEQGMARLLSIAERRLDHPIPVIPIGFAYQDDGEGRWNITMRCGDAIRRSLDESLSQFEARVELHVRQLSGVTPPASHAD
jgi:putative membrane protein